MQRTGINLISQNAEYIGVHISQDNIVDNSIFYFFQRIIFTYFSRTNISMIPESTQFELLNV
jgi:hypothetical protein